MRKLKKQSLKTRRVVFNIAESHNPEGTGHDNIYVIMYIIYSFPKIYLMQDRSAKVQKVDEGEKDEDGG